ncbi:putative receptor-like protein kinase At4g00960 [Cucumis sativus]|uniref:putative receptor-like protein kinase At4g00960 n=1 Tax=Cucumis sativus TaxID=3659 RepID=UPI0012F4F532|nr:putative receptor-like protein kinase At4g00960 [Cucumis sativus]
MFNSSLLFSIINIIIFFFFFFFISPAICHLNISCSNDNANISCNNLRFSFFDSAAVSRVSRLTLPPTPPSHDLLPVSSPSLSPHTTTHVKEKKSKRLKTVVIIVLPVVVVLVVLIVSIIIFLRARKRRDEVASLEVDDTASLETLAFDIATIRTATNDFSSENCVGDSEHGVVYKGSLVNGQEIAVKRLFDHDSKSEDSVFKNEVLLLAKLQHPNLVRFLGFCLHEEERILVFEFLQNSSLDEFIFNPLKGQELDWGTRYKIIGGIARALVYLHHDSGMKVIHNNLKPTNILLDAEMNPKISDFSMVTLFQPGYLRNLCPGYKTPEYAVMGAISKKSDVFSFGVIALEIVTGKRNSSLLENFDDLISHVWRNWRAGTALNVVDPILKDGPTNEIMKCMNIGLLCAQQIKSDRPTMETVLLMLNSDKITRPIISPPDYYMNKFRITRSEFSSSPKRSGSHVIEIE